MLLFSFSSLFLCYKFFLYFFFFGFYFKIFFIFFHNFFDWCDTSSCSHIIYLWLKSSLEINASFCLPPYFQIYYFSCVVFVILKSSLFFFFCCATWLYPLQVFPRFISDFLSAPIKWRQCIQLRCCLKSTEFLL